MVADRDIMFAQLAGRHLDLLFGGRVFDPEQVFRQQFTESAMDFADGVRCENAACESAAVDPFLDFDMRPSFQLKVPLLRIPALVALEGALHIDGVRVVTFD